MTTKATNVEDVGEIGKAIRNHIINVEQLMHESRKLLVQTRATLRWLRAYAPSEALTIPPPYHFKDEEKRLSMQEVLSKQVSAINLLLGDER